MTGLVRKATLLGVCAVLAASSAMATVPDLTNSTVPAYIDVVQFWPATVPDAGEAGAVIPTTTVTLRDFANNPLSGMNVQICFTCDVRICQNPPPSANYTFEQKPDSTNCIRGITDVNGSWTFKAIGGLVSRLDDARGPDKIAGTADDNYVGRYGATKIFYGAAKTEFTGTTAVAYDQNIDQQSPLGGQPLGAADGSFMLARANSAGLSPTYSSVDINHSGVVNASDTSSFITIRSRFSRPATPGSSCTAAVTLPQTVCP